MNARYTLTALIGSLALAGSASAAIPQTVFTFPQAQNSEPFADFLDTVAVDGGTAYAFMRDLTNTQVTGVITAFDGVNFSTVMTQAQWSGSGAQFDKASGNGLGIVGGNSRSINFFSNSVYQVNLGTGTPTEVVSKATIDAATGVSSNLTAQFEVAGDGTIYSFDAQSDAIIAISPANAVSIEVPSGSLGATSLGGIGIDGDTILIGDNSNDQLLGWNTVTNTMSTILTEAQIDALASSAGDLNDGTVGFGDIFAAPDGLVYFYESDGDDLMSYDPADPAGTLQVIVTEAEFLAGPSSDIVGQLSWWNGSIAYTDQGLNASDGFFVVPEPTSLALFGLAGLLIARRRR